MLSHFTYFIGYVVFIITSFLASVESADQCMLNSKVLSCFSGVIMSIRSFFLLNIIIKVIILKSFRWKVTYGVAMAMLLSRRAWLKLSGFFVKNGLCFTQKVLILVQLEIR